MINEKITYKMNKIKYQWVIDETMYLTTNLIKIIFENYKNK